MKNMADNPKYSKLLKSLKKQLEQLCKQQGDTFGQAKLKV